MFSILMGKKSRKYLPSQKSPFMVFPQAWSACGVAVEQLLTLLHGCRKTKEGLSGVGEWQRSEDGTPVSGPSPHLEGDCFQPLESQL
jgi:hypothetical protein